MAATATATGEGKTTRRAMDLKWPVVVAGKEEKRLKKGKSREEAMREDEVALVDPYYPRSVPRA